MGGARGGRGRGHRAAATRVARPSPPRPSPAHVKPQLRPDTFQELLFVIAHSIYCRPRLGSRAAEPEGVHEHETASGNVLKEVKRESLSSQVYGQLRGEIMSGQIKPGETLNARRIAAEIGVSPTPVREALLQLVSEGALTLDRRRSVCVPDMTRERFVELRAIRMELEGLCAAKAAEAATEAFVESLSRISQDLFDAMGDGRYRKVLRLNRKFHLALPAFVDMPVLRSFIENLWAQTGPFLNYLYPPPASTSSADHPHSKLIECLAARDAAGARRAMADDIFWGGNVILDRMAEGD